MWTGNVTKQVGGVRNTMAQTGQSSIGDCVAEWDVHLTDGVHKVRFEHGTTSGKRVISVDGAEVRAKGKKAECI